LTLNKNELKGLKLDSVRRQLIAKQNVLL